MPYAHKTLKELLAEGDYKTTHEAVQSHVEDTGITPEAAAYHEGPALKKLKTDSTLITEGLEPLKEHTKKIKDLETEIKEFKAQPDFSKEMATAKEEELAALKKELTGKVAKAHGDVDALSKQHHEHGKNINKLKQEADKKLTAARYHKDPAEKLSEADYKKFKGELEKEHTEFLKQHEETGKVLAAHRTEIETVGGVKSKGQVISAAAGSATGKTTGEAGKTIEKMSKEKWDAQGGPIKKTWQAIKNNFKDAEHGGDKWWGKGARVIGAVGCGAIVVSGLKNLGRSVGMFEPKKDAEGKEIPTGIIVPIGQIVGGSLLGATVLAMGGKGKSVG
jgi:hypothetical protein